MNSDRKPSGRNVLPLPYSSLAEEVEAALSKHGQARRKLLQGLAAAAVLPGVAACGGRGQSVGASTASAAGADTAPLTVTSLRHPGLLHTEADFARMQQKLQANAEPWVSGWSKLDDHDYTSLNRRPNPQATVDRGGTNVGLGTMKFDMESAYQLALYWKITGDPRYGDLAVSFLNAWSSTMTSLTGSADRFIAAGLYGYQWANAAEIMRTYPGWANADVAKFQKWLLDIWYPLSHSFLTVHNGADITNYWSSWDELTLCGIFAMGVFCDRADLCNEALTYYTSTGRGNGAAAHNVYVLHPGYLGQWQESGRDQGHCTLSISCVASLCEMAWNQGVDLYGYWNNRFLAGAEYVAKSNLTDANGNFHDLPFSTYTNRQGTMTGVSGSGRPSLRPGWESIYNHYVNRKGLSAPWVTAMAAKLRPEWRDAGGDEPSFGTLTFSRDAYVGNVAPSGLTAVLHGGKVLLSWWGSAYATSYNVKRGGSANGPFMTIARITDPRTHTDTPGDGVWYYAITAVTGSGETDVSNVVRVALPYEARVILPLAGNTNDTSGFARHGMLKGGAGWGAGRKSGQQALALDGSSGCLALPDGIVSDLSDFTVSLWVNWAGGSSGIQRLFDFGSSDIAYASLFLESNRTRFTTTGTTYYGERSIYYYSAIPTNSWVHVAVTLSGAYGVLYINGVQVATDDRIEFAPFQMGKTRQNWLGRSQYSADPYFNGRLQDFRLYNGALTAQQIAALAAT
jgi:hypothetical protein